MPDAPSLQELIATTPPHLLWDVVDGLPPAYRDAALALLPPSQAQYLTADHPLDLATRLSPGWRTRPHLTLLSRSFAVAAEGGGKLIVSMPPQYGKSQTTSRWGPTWYLDRWPGRHAILMSYAESLARDRSREVRDTIAGSDELHAQIKRGAATQTRWETVDGGGMVAAGMRGGVTGHGAHLLLIDDPFKGWEEAHSRAVRDAAWNTYRAVALTRLAPGAVQVIVMTRWHEDDLVGRLLSDEYEGDPDEWTVLRIPAICEDPETDPLGRTEGEPLIRPDVDQTVEEAGAWLESKRRDLGPYLWNGLYQQRPGAAAGTIFLRGWWQYYRTAPDGQPQTIPRESGTIYRDGETVDIDDLRIVQSWDMAFKDTADSSYVVGQVWGIADADRFLLDQIREHIGFSHTKAAVKRLRDRWPSTSATYVEDKANGPAVINELRREVSGLIPSPSPSSAHSPRDSKESRGWATQGDVEAGNVWLPSPEPCPWVREFVDELADFPNGAHDDQVDAFTQMMGETRRGRARVRSARQHRVPGGIRPVS